VQQTPLAAANDCSPVNPVIPDALRRSQRLTHREIPFDTPTCESDRYVALGDSVPYGHGLSNPYPTSRPNDTGQSQGPSLDAYPSLVAKALGLNLTVRSTNCSFGDDQESVSGAPASSSDPYRHNAPSGDTFQCNPLGGSLASDTTFSVSDVQTSVADLADDPASLVTIQAGADDIDFAQCLKNALIPGYGQAQSILEDGCVSRGQVTQGVGAELNNVTRALVSTIMQVSPYANQVAVLNYYNPVPNPNDFVGSSTHSGLNANPVCLPLSLSKANTYNESRVIQAALNAAIADAVTDAKNAGITNVTLVNISNVFLHHEMCTGDPAVFSGEPLPASRLRDDLGLLDECYATPVSQLFRHFNGGDCSGAVSDLESYTWRAAHPNKYGQQDIANAVLQALGSSSTSPPT
jgi:hypothetical protein